jgi:hypothetical protein
MIIIKKKEDFLIYFHTLRVSKVTIQSSVPDRHLNLSYLIKKNAF